MYKITGDHHYLEQIFPYYDYYAAPCYVYCWNDVWGGVQCILGEITSEQYPNFIDEYKKAAGKSPYEEMNCWRRGNHYTGWLFLAEHMGLCTIQCGGSDDGVGIR